MAVLASEQVEFACRDPPAAYPGGHRSRIRQRTLSLCNAVLVESITISKDTLPCRECRVSSEIVGMPVKSRAGLTFAVRWLLGVPVRDPATHVRELARHVLTPSRGL
jgi:hypothetical protein